MIDDVVHEFAAYPMVEEADATGVVAGVYARLLKDMPFVPSLFKSLAVCPGYLVLAAEQAAPALTDDSFRSSAAELAATVRTAATPPPSAEVRAAVAGFVDPLSRMLLLTAGLRLALAGELDAPAAPGVVPPSRNAHPEHRVPSPSDAPATELYGEIRSALQTPIVNSIWRSLAAKGLLEQGWAALGPQVAATVRSARDVRRQAIDAARAAPWTVAASPSALQATDLTDAAPGMASILDAYLSTLPRVLALVACTVSADEGDR